MTWEPIMYEKVIQQTDGSCHTVVRFADGVILPEVGQDIIATIEVMEGVKIARKIVTMTLTDNYWEKIYNICAWMPGRDIPSGISPYQGSCGYSVVDEQLYYAKVFQGKKQRRNACEEKTNKNSNYSFNSFRRQQQISDSIEELKNEVKKFRNQLNDKKENI